MVRTIFFLNFKWNTLHVLFKNCASILAKTNLDLKAPRSENTWILRCYQVFCKQLKIIVYNVFSHMEPVIFQTWYVWFFHKIFHEFFTFFSVVACLTLATFWTHPSSNHRIFLGCLNLFILVFMLSEARARLPMAGSQLPLVGKYTVRHSYHYKLFLYITRSPMFCS